MSNYRKELRARDGQRATFTGTFKRFGVKNGWMGPEKTVLLQSIRDSQGQQVTDHLWFNLTKGFEQLDLHPGDEVQFDARVKAYEKGYRGHREDLWDAPPPSTDYKLSHPTKMQVTRRGSEWITKSQDQQPMQTSITVQMPTAEYASNSM